MADDDDQGTSSGPRPKLLLPKAPGPAQPLSHAASRHRKKLDARAAAALSRAMVARAMRPPRHLSLLYPEYARRTRAPPRESGADLRGSVDAIVVCHVSEITSK